MSEALAAKLAELSARFRQRASEDCAALAEAVAADDRPAVAERAHKLAGNAGMFGYAGIGAAALELELAAETKGDMRAPAERLLALLAAL